MPLRSFFLSPSMGTIPLDMSLLHRPKANGQTSRLASPSESHVSRFADVSGGAM